MIKQSHTCINRSEHLACGLPEHVSQPLWAADHEAMPAIASLNDVEGTRLQLLGSVDYHLHYLRSEGGLILLSEHIRGGNVAPGGVCLYAGVNAEALMGESGRPIVRFSRGKVVVEYLLCVIRVDVHDPFLDVLT